jgi:hypothetical protein
MSNVLLIDDQKELYADYTARTYEEGIKALKKCKWDLLYLDHDLGCFDNAGREWTGYDILVWLKANPVYLPKKIQLVTFNIVGRERMIPLLKELYGEDYEIHDR